MNSTKPTAVAGPVERPVGRLVPECATTPHAVRWAQREIRGRFEMQYSAWHWTDDASTAVCGRRIRLISDGPALLPETRDDRGSVTCRHCIARLADRHEPPNAMYPAKPAE